MDILLLQSLLYRSVVGIVKESGECGCSVKIITSKGLRSKLTLARAGENKERIPAVREAAASSSSGPDHHTKSFTDTRAQSVFDS